MPRDSSDADIVVLPGAAGTWHLWRDVAVRGCGFPVELVLQLGSADASARADELAEARDAELRLRRAVASSLDEVRDDGFSDKRARAVKAKRMIEKGGVPSDTGTPVDADIAALRAAITRTESAAAAFAEAFTTAQSASTHALRAIAADERMREAITWQNVGAIGSALDAILARDPSKPLNSKDRVHEALVARYLQRYCTKNDTIGFFGPLGWARLTDASEPLVVRPGENLLASRGVYFEHWGIDVIAEKLSADADVLAWMAPRRFPFVAFEDEETVKSAVSGTEKIGRSAVALLRAADGGAPARDVASSLVRAGVFASEEEVSAALAMLRDKKLLAWSVELPLGWKPDERLRRVLDAIGDAPTKARALAILDEIVEAKRRIEIAAGDPARVATALGELDSTFTRVTGGEAKRQAGSMYAGRQLAFEDCRRDLDVAIGRPLLADLGPALSLVLASARWMAREIEQAYRARLRTIYEDLASRSGQRRVRFIDVWFRAQRALFGAKDPPFQAVASELRDRWARIFAIASGVTRASFSSADLASRVATEFASAKPTWQAAWHQSPDIMIAAKDVDAIARGEHLFVLGELHPAVNAFDTAALLAQHPNEAELYAAFARDLPRPRVMPVLPKDWPGNTARTNSPLSTPETFWLETGFDPAAGPRDRVLALADLTMAEEEGELRVRDATGRMALEIVDLLGQPLSALVSGAFRILPPAAHSPRVTIDRLVVSRESWTVPAADLEFSKARTDAAVFAGMREWKRSHGLPRFVFMKSPLEVKPLFIDLDSVVFTGILAKLARVASNQEGAPVSLAFSEMLPTPDEAWLTDRAAHRYASELRFVALDASGDV